MLYYQWGRCRKKSEGAKLLAKVTKNVFAFTLSVWRKKTRKLKYNIFRYKYLSNHFPSAVSEVIDEIKS